MTGGGGWHPGGDDADPPPTSAIRPFLGRAGAPGTEHRSPAPPADDQASGVRPYYLTRGRVASADARVRVETVVVAMPELTYRLAVSDREHQQLLALAARPTSVAELSVAMGVPVGVALVLVGDLARDGLLELSAPAVAPCDDVALIRRLIDGVCAL